MKDNSMRDDSIRDEKSLKQLFDPAYGQGHMSIQKVIDRLEWVIHNIKESRKNRGEYKGRDYAKAVQNFNILSDKIRFFSNVFSDPELLDLPFQVINYDMVKTLKGTAGKDPKLYANYKDEYVIGTIILNILQVAVLASKKIPVLRNGPALDYNELKLKLIKSLSSALSAPAIAEINQARYFFDLKSKPSQVTDLLGILSDKNGAEYQWYGFDDIKKSQTLDDLGLLPQMGNGLLKYVQSDLLCMAMAEIVSRKITEIAIVKKLNKSNELEDPWFKPHKKRYSLIHTQEMIKGTICKALQKFREPEVLWQDKAFINSLISELTKFLVKSRAVEKRLVSFPDFKSQEFGWKVESLISARYPNMQLNARLGVDRLGSDKLRVDKLGVDKLGVDKLGVESKEDKVTPTDVQLQRGVDYAESQLFVIGDEGVGPRFSPTDGVEGWGAVVTRSGNANAEQLGGVTTTEDAEHAGQTPTNEIAEKKELQDLTTDFRRRIRSMHPSIG